MKNIILFLLLVFTTFTNVAQEPDLSKFGIDEQANIPQGLKVGDTVKNFRGIDQNGDNFILSEASQNGPVIVIFYRGVWCGYCTKHLMAFEADLNLLTEKGAQVVAISPEVELLRDKTIKKTKVSFPIISDMNGTIMEQFDVAFNVTENYIQKVKDFADMELTENHNQDIPKLPIPATYIIGKDGVVKHVFFNPDYSKRSAVSELLELL
jgi:peroxiredoxin